MSDLSLNCFNSSHPNHDGAILILLMCSTLDQGQVRGKWRERYPLERPLHVTLQMMFTLVRQVASQDFTCVVSFWLT